ncbi:right-handed parallel beta-helix repeat-containing protein [Dyella flava]|uniref:Right-handed parallel beta-helix repeat-containing protein n=1 Tax=Dyella flava TaxID=1920170 RepID=A0ABS2K1C3_9GAMM|nr:right-handed parallel beta-helix repeat-containing protein [Dyella flava]MBM7125055.1 right-handed parallel beta-helix repeat-containing protein [Dyella flava]
MALPASATNWWNPAPTITVGPTTLNVQNFGAIGNGSTDDTAAFNAAINALPSGGGTIVVPNGTYMINGLTGISMKSNTRLSLQGNASINEIANSSERSSILKIYNVNNVEVLGGHFVGERVNHQGTAGEWGYGIDIEGSSTIYVHDLAVSNCFGDGVLVSATGSGSTAVLSSGVTINRVQSSNNRRQGMTVGPVNELYVVNSSFTGSNGVAPQAGIDIEPQTQGNVTNVRIEDSTLSNNVGNGLEMHANVSGVVLTGTTAENNQGFGVFDGQADNVQITSNNITQNYLFGVDIATDTNAVQITDNTITYNYDLWFYDNNESIFTEGWDPRDISIESGATNITVTGNTISPQR